MLCVPIPPIAHSRLPLKRKLVLCHVFGPGVLDVLFAILNRYYNFVMPHDLVFLAWYNGEASTTIMIATVPFCWVLLRRLFALDSWAGSSGGKQVVAANGGPPTTGSGQRVALGGGGIIRCWRCHYYACCKSLRTRSSFYSNYLWTLYVQDGLVFVSRAPIMCRYSPRTPREGASPSSQANQRLLTDTSTTTGTTGCASQAALSTVKKTMKFATCLIYDQKGRGASRHPGKQWRKRRRGG